MSAFAKLCDDVLLSCINIAGTHDSATAYVDFENQAKCQKATVSQQLEMGIRLLDIRLALKGGRYFLVHSLANCYEDAEKKCLLYFDKVFSECKTFLKENPEETIVMSIKQDRGIQNKSFFEGFYRQFIKNDDDIWCLGNEFPRLKDCRGKIVLVRRCKVKKKFLLSHECGLDFSHWPDQDRKITSPCSVFLDKSGTFAKVQDRYKLSPEKKWYECARPFLDSCITDSKTAAIHFLSTSSRGVNPFKASEYINPLFSEYEMPCDRAVGWIFMDFPDEKLCSKITESNLRIKERDDVK